jgi:chromosome segregation ATPase
LTDTYVIAPRTCKRGYSVSLEEVHNRVRRVCRELEKELAELDDQREIELRLEEENESLFDQYAPVMTLVEFNKSIAKLTARLSQLDEDISVMKMDLLRLKGAIRSFRNNAGGKNSRGSIETLSLSNWNPFRRGSCNF